MTASGDFLSQALKDKGIDVGQVAIDPTLPKLKLPKGVFSNWIKTFTDVDAICLKQVELLQNSPLIPEDVFIHGYIWEVETMSLRRPHERLSKKVNTAENMGAKTHLTPQIVSTNS